MIKISFISLLLIFSTVSYAQTTKHIYNCSNGVINFLSDAPLELIKASSNELHGKFDVEKKMFAFVIRINSFKGFNSPLQQEHFNENYMESDRYPEASFSGKIIEDIDFTKDGIFTIRAKGNLIIHGIAQERIIKCDIVIKKAIVSVRSNFSIMLSEHNIPIPKVVHEKLASEIKIEVKADLQ